MGIADAAATGIGEDKLADGAGHELQVDHVEINHFVEFNPHTLVQI